MNPSTELDDIRLRLTMLEGRDLSGNKDEITGRGEEIIDRMRHMKSKTALDELRSMYHRFFIIAFIFGTLQLMVMSELIPLWGRVLVGSYFFVAGLMDLYLWEGIKSIDITHMGVAEVARKAVYYRRFHHICQMILIPMGVCVIVVLCLGFPHTPAVIAGIICGCAFGLACGLRLYLRMMRNYRTLTDTESYQ